MIARRILFVAITVAGLAASSALLSFGVVRWAAGDLATIAREARRERMMERELVVTSCVYAGKRRVAAEMLAGRCMLREAADRFRVLNATRVEGLDGREAVPPYRMFSGEEGLWRNVYFFVEEQAAPWRHEPAAEILARLKAEYRQKYGHDPVEYWPRLRPSRTPQGYAPPAQPDPAAGRPAESGAVVPGNGRVE
jgi:hypothetical protein